MKYENIDSASDEKWMDYAISLSRSAAELSEVPVGAIIVRNNCLVSTGLNLRETTFQPTAHAEILAIQEAAKKLGRWRLNDCDLYVTLEPCLMCAGAIYQSRINRVVFGCRDPKGGAFGSLYALHSDSRLNHRCSVTEGVRSMESSKILSSFFIRRRRENSYKKPIQKLKS